MPAHDLTIPPATTGRFGVFGGRYVPETLIPALDELERAYDTARADPTFEADVERVAQAGADAVLVGSSVSSAADPSDAVRGLTGVRRIARGD